MHRSALCRVASVSDGVMGLLMRYTLISSFKRTSCLSTEASFHVSLHTALLYSSWQCLVDLGSGTDLGHNILLMSVNMHFRCQVYKARDVGVNSVVLFPKVPDALKVSLTVIYFFSNLKITRV